MRILFQGDSITDGNRGRGEDPNHIIGHSYTYTVASYLGSKYPEKKLAFYSKGVSGDDIRNLYGRWQIDTLSLEPDIVVMLVGINDAVERSEAKEDSYVNVYEETYVTLLEQCLKVNPNVKFVILEPFTLDVGNITNFKKVEKYTKEYAESCRGIAEKFGASFIPLQKIFQDALLKAPVEYWVWDSVHPTYNGHGLIANAVIEELEKIIN